MKRQAAALVFFGSVFEFGRAVVQAINVAPVAMAAPADNVRRQFLAKRRRDVHETRSGGRHQPLVTVDGEYVYWCLADVEGQGAYALRSIQKQREAARR